jgi:hypothetical protein
MPKFNSCSSHLCVRASLGLFDVTDPCTTPETLVETRELCERCRAYVEEQFDTTLVPEDVRSDAFDHELPDSDRVPWWSPPPSALDIAVAEIKTELNAWYDLADAAVKAGEVPPTPPVWLDGHLQRHALELKCGHAQALLYDDVPF